MKKLLIIILLITGGICAQSKDASKILKAVKEKFDKVENYQADVKAKLDMELVKVPESNATVYFKQPDKFKIVPKGFSMIPKQSMNFSPAQLLKGDYTSVYVRSEVVANVKMDVVKMIPNSDTTEIILSTLWIDTAQHLIQKVETTTKGGGTIVTEFSYDSNSTPLPAKLKFSFNMGDVKATDLPAQNETNNKARNNRRSMKIKGTVVMNYYNYKINKGVPDSIFEEKKKK